jgi:murein DD-endopeptidase MepM/ murein hydrolase activator NlpD
MAPLRYSAELARFDASPALGVEHLPVPVVETVKFGDTPLRLLSQLGLDGIEANSAAAVLAAVLDPRQLRAGTRYVGYVGRDRGLEDLIFELPDRGHLALRRERAGGWETHLEPYDDQTVVAVARGELANTLEAAVRETGAPPALAYRLAQVFQWDLDFNRDLRQGDRFAIVYQQVWRDGRLHGVGAVVAASYENRGRTLEAFRFGDDGGYYDRSGAPLRKQFLRSPMEFSRITSSFSNRRFHPVLKVHRPHYGVDYGAPVGTPVRVTASGVVASAGWDDGGGGRTVKVRHPNGFLTAYLHLSRFADGLRSGGRVQQGDVIGFVGATGLASGPHLDYRVQRNGRWIDPLSLKSEKVPPLNSGELASFVTERAQLDALLVAAEHEALPQLADRSPRDPGLARPTAP